MHSELRQNGDFLLSDHGNQINDPEDTEEVTGNQLQHTNDNTRGIAARDTEQRAVDVIYDDEQELCDPRNALCPGGSC